MSALRIGLFFLLAAASLPAAAYIGPGSGLSLLGGLWTLVVGIVLVLGAILFWPIRYMIRRIRARNTRGPARHSSDSENGDDA